MSRTAARFTQADVARSIRAAKQAGAAGIELRPDGILFTHIIAPVTGENITIPPEKQLEARPRPVL